MITDTTAYKKFFQSFKELYTPSAELSQIDINLTEAKDYFQKFKASHSAARQQGLFFNIWDIANIGKKEVPNCAVLTWLLDCYGSHGQGNFFANALFSLLKKSDILHSEYFTKTEDNYYDETANRVDIVLENRDFCVFIETKIYAPEQPRQRERYETVLKNKTQKEKIFVYLTPYKLQNDHDTIHYLTWNDISLTFLTAIQNNSAMPEFIKTIVQQYCYYIQNF